ENALTIGNGAVQLVRAPRAPLVSLACIVSVWGFTLKGAPTIIAVNCDGSMTEVFGLGITNTLQIVNNLGNPLTILHGLGNPLTLTTGGTVPVATFGTVSQRPHLTIWRESPILILDPDHGYLSWDGTTFRVIDATRTGDAIAVFEGRVWIAKG